MVQDCSWIQNVRRKRSVDISTRSFKRIEEIAGSDASNRRVFGGLCKRDWTASKVSWSYFYTTCILWIQYRVCNICLNSSIIIFITYKNLCLDSVGAFVLALYSQMMMKGNFVWSKEFLSLFSHHLPFLHHTHMPVTFVLLFIVRWLRDSIQFFSIRGGLQESLIRLLLGIDELQVSFPAACE